MSITYSTIIDYLIKDKEELHHDLFITNKNDYTNISKIFNIFNDDYYCYGVL